jgi:hypothetical protein
VRRFSCDQPAVRHTGEIHLRPRKIAMEQSPGQVTPMPMCSLGLIKVVFSKL